MIQDIIGRSIVVISEYKRVLFSSLQGLVGGHGFDTFPQAEKLYVDPNDLYRCHVWRKDHSMDHTYVVRI